MKSSLRIFAILLALVTLVSCGKKGHQIVSGIEYETIGEQEKYLNTQFTLDLGNTELPYFFVELEKDYGSVSIASFDGKSYVNLSLNLSEVLKVPATRATLPNGTAIPVDTNNIEVVELPINDIRGKVYVAASNDYTMIGFAISIKGLDGVGEELGRVNLFLNYAVGEVNGIAGLFSDSEVGQTGLTAFANLSGVVNFRTEYVSRYTAKKAQQEIGKLFYSPKKIKLELAK